MKDSPSLPAAACRMVALSCIVVAAGLGCARTKIVEIITTPAKSTIYVDGEDRGLSPGTIKINFTANVEQRVFIQLVKDGYVPVAQPWLFDEVPPSNKWIVKLDDD